MDAKVPRGLLHWKGEMAGREMTEDVGPHFWEPRIQFHFKLFRADSVPAGMVRIASAAQPFQIFMPGLDHLPEVKLPDYWIDRDEVTNRAFKRFVDDGGYRRAELWREPFLKDGRTLTFDAAMTQFRDATGRPGPATWEMGSYFAGQDDYPVGGVSWYEAAAYARWAGKSLPTIYHWSRAADHTLSADVVPASNFSGKSLLPTGASGGITRGGTTDMAGNRERVVPECRRRETLHPGRRVDRTALHVHRPGRPGAVRAPRRRMDSAASRRIGRRICPHR